jgi:Mce-associated membrane protein
MTTTYAPRQVATANDDLPAACDTTPTPARPRATRRALLAGICLAAAAFIGVSGFAGAALYGNLAAAADTATRHDVASTAAAALTTLWTYNPDTIGTLPTRAEQYLGGGLSTQYRQFLEGVAAPTKQARTTNTTNVVGIAVESLRGDDAEVLAFTNTTVTSLTHTGPALKFIAYRLGMHRQARRWLLTTMTTISYLDLSPTT